MRFTLTCAAVLAAGIVAASAHAAGDAAAGKAKSVTCAACHGVDGNSPSPQWPKLAGQHADYLERQLTLFKAAAGAENPERADPQMAPMVASLSEQDMADLAAYYASNVASGGFASEERAAAGKRIYEAGKPDVGAASCMSCHGPAGKGDPNGGFPALAGQHAAYTATQLKAFRSGTRHSDVNAMMRDVARWLSDEEIEAVSEYVAGLH